MERANERILVGVDGSSAGNAALRWAVDHAGPDDTLVVAYAWKVPSIMGFEKPVYSISDVEVAAHRQMRLMLAQAELDTDNGPTIETRVEMGEPGPTLAKLSEDVDMVVVGSRGLGGFRGLMLGSVSNYVVHNVHCPVVIIPTNNHRPVGGVG